MVPTLGYLYPRGTILPAGLFSEHSRIEVESLAFQAFAIELCYRGVAAKELNYLYILHPCSNKSCLETQTLIRSSPPLYHVSFPKPRAFQEQTPTMNCVTLRGWLSVRGFQVHGGHWPWRNPRSIVYIRWIGSSCIEALLTCEPWFIILAASR